MIYNVKHTFTPCLFYSTDSGDMLLASAAQDYMIRVWRFAPQTKDYAAQNKSAVTDLLLDRDIQMRETTLSFTHKG